MKRPNQSTLLGLTLLIGAIVTPLGGCGGDREKGYLGKINSDLAGIHNDLTLINRRLARLQGGGGGSSHAILVTADANGVQIPADEDPAYLSKAQGNEIVWITVGDATNMSIEYKNNLNPFKNPPECKDLKKRTLCASGPIDKSYDNGPICHTSDPDGHCFTYRICVILPDPVGKKCSVDPGIIIHP